MDDVPRSVRQCFVERTGTRCVTRVILSLRTLAALRHSVKRIRAAVTEWGISVVGRVNALKYVADETKIGVGRTSDGSDIYCYGLVGAIRRWK